MGDGDILILGNCIIYSCMTINLVEHEEIAVFAKHKQTPIQNKNKTNLKLFEPSYHCLHAVWTANLLICYMNEFKQMLRDSMQLRRRS